MSGTVLRGLPGLPHLILTIVLQSRYLDHPHFKDEKTESRES